MGVMDTLVDCPRPQCADGSELVKDHGDGRQYRMSCHLCRGTGLVSRGKAQRWLNAEAKGPPSTPAPKPDPEACAVCCALPGKPHAYGCKALPSG